MSLDPRQSENWFLLVAVHATRPGKFVIASIRVDYTVGWRHGSSTYPYSAEVDAS